jgi:hypothetical protein
LATLQIVQRRLSEEKTQLLAAGPFETLLLMAGRKTIGNLALIGESRESTG